MTDLDSREEEASEKLVDLDMIMDVKEKEPGMVKIDFVSLSPFCQITSKLDMDIRKAVTGIEGVKKALVYSYDHIMEEAINKMFKGP